MDTASQLPSWLNPDVIPDGLPARVAAAQVLADTGRQAIVALALNVTEVVEEIDRIVQDLPDEAWEATSEVLGFSRLHTTVANLSKVLDAATNGERGRENLSNALLMLTPAAGQIDVVSISGEVPQSEAHEELSAIEMEMREIRAEVTELAKAVAELIRLCEEVGIELPAA